MTSQEIHDALKARFGEAILSFDEKALDPWTLVKPESIAEVAAFVKAEPTLGFDNLMCLSAVDWPKETPPRLDVVYHLYSYKHDHTFVLKVQVPRENPRLPTVEGTWGVANWHEREAFDLYGVVFDGHSDLRRILLPDDRQGHPRRDPEGPRRTRAVRRSLISAPEGP